MERVFLEETGYEYRTKHAKGKSNCGSGQGRHGKDHFYGFIAASSYEKYKDKAILAVDADANANLNEALGLEVKETISMALDDIKDRGLCLRE